MSEEIIEEGSGTTQCPICGNGEPHHHQPKEVAWHTFAQQIGTAVSPADYHTYREFFFLGYEAASAAAKLTALTISMTISKGRIMGWIMLIVAAALGAGTGFILSRY